MRRIVTVFAAVILATAISGTAVGQPGTDTEKTALYQKFLDNYKKGVTEQAAARAAVKEYLEKFGNSTDDNDKKIADYVERWAGKYDIVARRLELSQALVAEKGPAAFRLAKLVLADSPDDLEVQYKMASVGFKTVAGGDKSVEAETLAYAKRSLELLLSGKSFDASKPMDEKQRADAVALMRYSIVQLKIKSSPADAKPHLLELIHGTTAFKTESIVYFYLASVMSKLEYEPLLTKYKTDCEGKEENDPCKEQLKAITRVVEKMLDATARAAAYADSGPNAATYAKSKAAWTSQAEALYKFLHDDSNTGFAEYMSGITSKPLPY